MDEHELLKKLIWAMTVSAGIVQLRMAEYDDGALVDWKIDASYDPETGITTIKAVEPDDDAIVSRDYGIETVDGELRRVP